jgi:hypothetical protein
LKYQIEYCPNPDVLMIHTNQRLVRGTMAVFEYFDLGEGAEEDFRKEANEADQLISFCRAVTELDGMQERISFSRYDIQMEKASMFSWDDIVPSILDALRTFVAKGNSLEEFAPAKRPTEKELEALRKEGCEV